MRRDGYRTAAHDESRVPTLVPVPESDEMAGRCRVSASNRLSGDRLDDGTLDGEGEGGGVTDGEGAALTDGEDT